MEPRITLRVKEVGDLLLSLKGGAQVTLNQPAARSQIAADADDVLQPLMDLLDGTIRFIGASDNLFCRVEISN